MSSALLIVVGLIAVALTFDFINGFHDAANSIATVVSTRVLSPGAAVIWAAFFNFIAFAIFGTKVASTIGKGMLNLQLISEEWRLWAIFSGVMGDIIWNMISWYFGLS